MKSEWVDQDEGPSPCCKARVLSSMVFGLLKELVALFGGDEEFGWDVVRYPATFVGVVN